MERFQFLWMGAFFVWCSLALPFNLRAEPDIQIAPVNQKFLQHMNKVALGKDGPWVQRTQEGHFFGYVPGPQQPPSFAKTEKKSLTALSFPTKYDLRTTDKLTAIRNQGACGSCWAFATYSSLESFFKPLESHDFSEQHLIENHGFDWGPCDGGNMAISSAYLLRWDGPMSESDFPYLNATFQSSLPQKHVQHIIWLPPRASALDNDTIKQAVMTYGAVYTTYYHSDTYYNKTYHSYYYNGGVTDINHAIAIVGWDDDFDKNRFNTHAPGNGAFIFRNSWGQSWGDGGYGYVSYYDTLFARNEEGSAVVTVEDDKYAQVYQHDALGYVASYYSCGPGCGWGANIFTAENDQVIGAIGFYALAANTSYLIQVYTDVPSNNPAGGTLQCQQTESISTPGYLTIPLISKVSVTKAQKFSVVVRLNSSTYNYPIPMEIKLSGYSSKAVSEKGQSFLSASGSSWTDLLDVWGPNYSANVCVKAYVLNTLSGTIYDQNDQPLVGTSVRIEVYDQDPCTASSQVSYADTDISNGSYTISGLPNGKHYYVLSGRTNPFYEEWFGANGSDCSKAIAVIPNTNHVNFKMTPFQPGDINADRVVDLSDIIIGLKISTGASSSQPNMKSDVNTDGKIGIAEILYQMQHIAGLK
uniref:Peptidase C1 n=1 Tax=Desulfatirhabdium butyrativorans TaxID=340467 RepID=A0A7C4VRL6_9BACT